MTEHRPIVCIDFDGVIHSYDRGWQNGEIYGEVVTGFFEWALVAQNYFELVVYSSRSKTLIGTQKMAEWLDAKYSEWQKTAPISEQLHIQFSHEKPPAFITIDDRAITFKGRWDSEELNAATMLNFKPWNAT